MLSYPELLNRAETEIAQILKSLTDLRNQDYELSHLRNRLDIKNLDEFHSQRKDLSTQIYYLEFDLRRLRGHAAITRGKIAAGLVRESLVAA